MADATVELEQLRAGSSRRVGQEITATDVDPIPDASHQADQSGPRPG